MEPKKITDDLSVGGQIAPADLERLGASGFRSIVINRPDGESPGQPSFEEIRATAEKAGIEVRYLPVETGKIRNTDAAAFLRMLDELPKPVLAICRSGTRSTVLWALSQVGRRPLSEIQSRAEAAGYDLSGVLKSLRTPSEEE